MGVARTAYVPRLDLLWQANRATRNNVFGLLFPQAVVPPISGPVLGTTMYDSVWGSAAGVLLSWQAVDFGVRRANVEAARAQASLANAQGTASVESGQAAVLAMSEAPLFLASPQDADALLKRLEQLAARVAKLEDEVGRLEAKNKQLKEQLKSNGVGGAWFGGGGPGGAVRVIQSPGSTAPGQPVIIELEERLEKANPNKDK